jgi:hypothetical protein
MWVQLAAHEDFTDFSFCEILLFLVLNDYNPTVGRGYMASGEMVSRQE